MCGSLLGKRWLFLCATFTQHADRANVHTRTPSGTGRRSHTKGKQRLGNFWIRRVKDLVNLYT